MLLIPRLLYRLLEPRDSRFLLWPRTQSSRQMFPHLPCQQALALLRLPLLSPPLLRSLLQVPHPPRPPHLLAHHRPACLSVCLPGWASVLVGRCITLGPVIRHIRMRPARGTSASQRSCSVLSNLLPLHHTCLPPPRLMRRPRSWTTCQPQSRPCAAPIPKRYVNLLARLCPQTLPYRQHSLPCGNRIQNLVVRWVVPLFVMLLRQRRSPRPDRSRALPCHLRQE